MTSVCSCSRWSQMCKRTTRRELPQDRQHAAGLPGECLREEKMALYQAAVSKADSSNCFANVRYQCLIIFLTLYKFFQKFCTPFSSQLARVLTLHLLIPCGSLSCYADTACVCASCSDLPSLSLT